MKYFEHSTYFRYTWEQVSQGFWQRYPNPESTHVLSEDTLSRSVKDGKLYTQRLLTKTNRVPKWGERFVPNKVVKIVEESVVDPVAKTLVTYTKNIGLQRVMMVEEKVTYTSNTDDNSTHVERSAWVTSQVYGFSRAIEAFGMDRFKKNCHKMAYGFEFILARLFPNMATMGVAQDAAERVSKTDKLKDAAKKASDIAKTQANTMFATCTPSDE